MPRYSQPGLRQRRGSGRRVAAFGARGEGPGEYLEVSWVELTPEDSLFALDGALMRLTVGDANGAVSRTVDVRPVVEPSGRPLTDRGGRFTDGSLLAVPSAFLAPRGPPEGVAYTNLLRVREDGLTLADLGRFPHFEYVRLGRGVRVPALFGRRLGHAVSGKDRIYVGFGDSYEITELDPAGNVVRIIRRRHRPVEIGSEHIERAVRRSDDDEEEARRILSARVTSRTLPAFGSRWFVDDLDRLWVPDMSEGAGTDLRWSLFGSAGRWLRDVFLPVEFRPTEAGRTHVLGVWRDPDLGTRSVRRYAFVTVGG